MKEPAKSHGLVVKRTWYRRMWRKHYALPPEHGAWTWWAGPMIVGVAAAGQVSNDLWLLVVAAVTGFAVRQPLTLLVKVMTGLRGNLDLLPAAFWALVEGALLVCAAMALALRGHLWIVPAGLLGIALVAAQLVLVGKRADRHQMPMQLAAAYYMAFAGPAAYWVCGGEDWLAPWLVYLLMALNNSATILHVRVRLEQRKSPSMPSADESWIAAMIPLSHHAVNLVICAGLAFERLVPPLAPLAFLLVLIEVAWAAAVPPVGVKATRIGLRQLAASSIFVAVLAAAYLWK